MVNDLAVQEFVEAIKEAPTDTNTTYNAVVSRIDSDGVVWINLQGSEKETPAASSSSEIKAGDRVTVNWRNNKLYIGGNYSNPSAGVTTVQPSVDYVSELIEKDVTVNSINAATGYIGDLTADHITAGDISASSGYIKDLKADNIEADDIIADHGTIGSLDVNYAKVNAANIDSAAIRNAWVDKIMVQTGLLAYSSQVYTLDAIEVNAANITAGTLDVNRLIVTVGEGSSAQKYLVNIDPSTGTPSYEKLDGNIVAPRTITADKIVTGAITTNEITANNLQGTSGWINLHEGKFFYGDGANFASATNAISWNGSKLQIKADEFLLSTGKTIQDSIESVENWFYSVPPTTSNPPASSWTTTNLKEQHLRDIYFDTTSGKSYRWSKDNNVYSWVEIEDVELAALTKDLHDNYPPRSEFTVAPDQIQSTVSAAQTAATNAANTATDNKLTSYSTTTQMNSAIEQKAGEISLSVAQTEISKIEVGGRNLLSNSQTITKTWSKDNATVSDGVATVTCVSSGNARIYQQPNNGYWTWQANQDYTVSVDAKASTSGLKFIFNAVGISKGSSDIALTTDWKRYTWTVSTTSVSTENGSISFLAKNGQSGTVQFRNPKLEYGNKATDWTPAPEDLENYADGAVATAKAEIKVTTDGISTEVSKKVGSSEIISKINQSAETVKIEANKVEIDGTAIFNNSDFQTALAAEDFATSSDIPTKVSELTNDSGYQNATQVSSAVSGKADKTSAVARQQRIYYRTTSSGAPSKNTTWLSSSGTGYGNWSLKIPQMTSGSTKYPYLYTAVQTQTVAQQAAGTTCTCSDVLLDDTTTVIDGGHILTNSIGANQIAANAITSDELAANSVIAGKIATGAVTADKIAVNSITANKLRMADYNNYVTVTENDESSLLPNGGITIVDGWCYKTSATDSNVGVSAIKANWTKTGEKYRVTGIAKAPAAGAVRIYLGGRNADGSWVIGNYCETALAADTETAISGIVTVSSALEACAKCNISVRFYSGSSGSTYQVGYFKQLRVERMSGAELIVDGSITTDKLAANAITIGKIASDTQSQILNSAVNVDARNYWVAIDSSKRTIGKGSVNYTYDEEGTYVLICTTASTGFAQINTQWIDATDLAGKTVIFHADSITKTNSSAEERVYIGMRNASGVALTGLTLNSSKLSTVVTLPTSLAEMQLIIRMDQNKAHAVGDVMTVVKPKLEIGHQATGWTQAPEDIELDIADSAKTATTYITAIDSDGIKVHAANNPTSNYAKINADGMEVYSNSDSVASFGADGVRVGKIQDPHIEFGSTSSNFYGNNQALVGSIKSGNETVGEYTESVGINMGYMQDNTIPITDAQLSYPPTGNLSLKVRVGSFQQTRTLPTTNDYDVTTDGIRVRFIKSTRQLTVTNTGKKGLANHTFIDQGTLEIINGEKRRAVIVSGDPYTKRTLTLLFDPKLGTTGHVAPYITKNNAAASVIITFTAGTAFTKNVTTTSYGFRATLTYDGKRTFTLTPITSGSAVNINDTQYTAEVFYAYSTVATYDRKFLAPQFLFGSQNEAGDYSYVSEFGEGLTAGAINQTIVGRFNAVGTKAFYVGNGSNSSSRSNAMEVDWSGNMTIAGKLTQSSDRRLKEHISYLDSDADDFIRDLKPAHYTKDNAKHVGFYAQDVEEADKWDCMVGEMNGYKTLGYTELIAPLVAYCQHLEKRIEALERTIK